jgi:hypothetical protein
MIFSTLTNAQTRLQSATGNTGTNATNIFQCILWAIPHKKATR